MKRLNIDGTPKDDNEYCWTCKNGKKFGQEQVFRTDLIGNNHREHICGVCDTKYKQQFIQLEFELENFPGERVTKEKFKEWRKINEQNLTKENEVYHMIAIALDYRSKVKQMNGQDYEILLENYEKTGECNHPEMIESRPFKTVEGTFSIKNCLICTIGTVKHRGKTYKDKLMNLVRYLSHMGVEYDKQIKEAEKQVDDLFGDELFADLKSAESSTKELPTFDIEEKPTFDIETKPVFEIEVAKPVF